MKHKGNIFQSCSNLAAYSCRGSRCQSILKGQNINEVKQSWAVPETTPTCTFHFSVEVTVFNFVACAIQKVTMRYHPPYVFSVPMGIK